MRVIVQGRLRQRSYETKEGEKRTVYEIEVEECGPSLRNASAKVTKTTRSNGQGGGGGQYGGDDPHRIGGGRFSGNQPAADPWAADAPAGDGDRVHRRTAVLTPTGGNHESNHAARPGLFRPGGRPSAGTGCPAEPPQSRSSAASESPPTPPAR